MKIINTKSAFIAILGKPNVGKSTLINTLTGQKIAIVSNKPQTTRNRIMGVLTKDENQFVFIDTPGLHKAKNKLGTHMVKAVRESFADVDAALLVVEPAGSINPAEKELMEGLQLRKIPCILVINKIDLLQNKETLINRIETYQEQFDFAAIVPISAKNKDGIDRLLIEISRFAKESVHFFPEDSLTDQPERILVAEIIREKLLWNLHEEIPHGIAVEIEKMSSRKKNTIIDIHAVIYCERENHKGMVIGKKGEMLKKVATAARGDIEHFFDTQINLQCWVKVKEDWRNKEGFIQSLGLS